MIMIVLPVKWAITASRAGLTRATVLMRMTFQHRPKCVKCATVKLKWHETIRSIWLTSSRTWAIIECRLIRPYVKVVIITHFVYVLFELILMTIQIVILLVEQETYFTGPRNLHLLIVSGQAFRY